MLQNPLGQVRLDEVARVVAAEAERGLRQVVGAEAEELGVLGDLVRGQRSARNLDHRADLVMHGPARFGEDLLGSVHDNLLLVLKFLVVADQRNHDLRDRVHALLRALHGRLEDGPGLHGGDLGKRDA